MRRPRCGLPGGGLSVLGRLLLDRVLARNNPGFEERNTEAEGLAPVDLDNGINRHAYLVGLVQDTTNNWPVADDLETIAAGALYGAVLGLVVILANRIEPHRDHLTIHWGYFREWGVTPSQKGEGNNPGFLTARK